MQASVRTTPSSIHIGCLVMNISLGKEGKIYQSHQEKFLESNGTEWTCSRAKTIWNIANLVRNGDTDEAISLCRENSISHSPHTGIPKGIEGRIVRRYAEAQRPVVIKRLAAALRWYTSLRLGETSQRQKKKALDAITLPCESQLSSKEIFELGKEHAFKAMDSFIENKLKELQRPISHLLDFDQNKDLYRDSYIRDRIRKQITEVKYADSLRATSKYYSRFKVPKDLRGEPYSSLCMSFISEPWLPETLDSRTPCKEMREGIRIQEGFSNDNQAYAGKITFLQEQGCKARVVAQPTGWLQLAFVPLHDTLADVAEKLFPAASRVRDQSLGASELSNAMMKGYYLYCTDLSSATDRFPLSYSLGVLSALGLDDWGEALKEVVSRPFESPYGALKYATGQPMGLYGSFPLFHLSNMVLANASKWKPSSNSLDVDEWRPKQVFDKGSCFLVVGDDIVFSDAIVSRRYKENLRILGVPTSDSKCFQGRVAEFAGFMSVMTNKSVCTFRPYKVPDTNWIKNPLQFLDSLGSSVGKLPKRSTYWLKQFRSFQYTKPFRDLALESLLPTEDQRNSATYRGDARTMVNLTNVICSTSIDQLPDVSQVMKVSSIPLFRERGMFDFYGYNPKKLAKQEESEKNSFRLTARRLNQDPLMKMEATGQLKELVTPHSAEQQTQLESEIIESSNSQVNTSSTSSGTSIDEISENTSDNTCSQSASCSQITVDHHDDCAQQGKPLTHPSSNSRDMTTKYPDRPIPQLPWELDAITQEDYQLE